MLKTLKSGLTVHTYTHNEEKLLAISFSSVHSKNGTVAQHTTTTILDRGHVGELIETLVEALLTHNDHEAK